MKLKLELHQCWYGCVRPHGKAQTGLAGVWINPSPMKNLLRRGSSIAKIDMFV